MKKDNSTFIDDYFRQHEPEIPVTFNPKHWEQLAAALGDAARDIPPPPPSTTRKHFFRTKAWWVFGLGFLLFTVWVSLHPSDNLNSSAEKTISEPSSVSPPADTNWENQSLVSAPNPVPQIRVKPDRGFKALPGPQAQAPESNSQEAKTSTILKSDSIFQNFDLQPIAPQDSIAPKPLKKKKKGLFW